MKVNRTKEGTMCEIACAVLLVIMWIVAIVLYKNSPQEVNTHFDITGTPDATGDKITILVIALAGTIATVVALISAYKPNKMVNMPFAVSNNAQFAKMVTMVRVIAMEVACIFIAVILMIGGKMTGTRAM